MGATSRRRHRPLYVRFGIVAAVFLFCCGSLRPDEFDCEEAASYVDHCCPGMAATANLDCEYIAPSGCCDSSSDEACDGRDPDLNEAQSDCVRKISCSSLCTALSQGATLRDICPP